ncbi:hypothetical protein C6A85_79405, partial [Mycobacterium sp. ITM-2017-0098]
MHGVTPSFRGHRRPAKALAVAAAALIPVLAACSDSEPQGPSVPSTDAPSQSVSHGPFFPE